MTVLQSAALFLAIICLGAGGGLLGRASFTPDDLLLREPIPYDIPPAVSREAKQHDLGLLLYAFEAAYGGYSYLPKSDRESFVQRLNALRESVRSGK